MCTMNAYVTMQMLCLRLTTSTRQHLKACVQVADGNMCHLCSLSVHSQSKHYAMHCTVKHSMSCPSLCFPGLRLSPEQPLCGLSGHCTRCCRLGLCHDRLCTPRWSWSHQVPFERQALPPKSIHLHPKGRVYCPCQ